MRYALRPATFSLWLVSLLPVSPLSPVACSSSDPKTVAPPDEQPDEMEPDPEPEAKFLLALDAERLPVLQGTRGSVTVTVERQNGFEGDVEITAQDLPEGVTAEPLTIGADETEGELELTAPESAPHSLPTTVKVSGESGELSDSRELVVTVYGPPGSLDTSFQGGKVLTPLGGADAYAYAIAAQPDGKLVLAGTNHDHYGDFAVLRLTRDGEPDPTFGKLGQVSTPIGENLDVARAVAVDAQGRIVVAGTATGAKLADFAVARYLPNGKLDPSFGELGTRIYPLGDDADTAYAILIQPDGKILIGGDTNRGENGLDFALLRLLEDGKPDPDFGDDGVVTQDVASFGARDSIYALALQEIDGEQRIVAAGGEGDFELARFHADGSLDATFGEDGKLIGLFESVIGAARGVAVTADGELVVAGHAQHDVALAKLTQDGEPVAEFGNGGRVLTKLSDNWDEATGLAIDSEGRFVLGGWVYEGGGSSANTALLRYSESGELDDTFGEGGIVITEVAPPQKYDQGSALVLVPDERVPCERIVVAGYASTNYSQFAVARFWP